jgi:hypothetical protein
MKTPAGMLVFACAMTFMGATALGQITINAADVSNAFAVGHLIATKVDTVATSLNIGAHGPTSWDFSSLRSDSPQTFTSVAVAGTPYAGQFPSATHALQTTLNVNALGQSIAATGDIYFQLSTFQISKHLLNLGERATAPTISGSLTANNTPADVYYGLPLAYGTTWASTYFDTTDILILTSILYLSSGERHNASYTVDAYGPMTLPGGSVHDALRIRKTDSVATYLSVLGQSPVFSISKYVYYIFIAKDLASVNVRAADPLQPDTGTIQISRKYASWNDQMVALPIQLVSFGASLAPAGGGVDLRWSTLSEVNNYGFEVQRGLSAGGDFATVPGGFIPGHGTTTVPQNYAFDDKGAPTGTSYYRLKQIDLDGAVHFSEPAQVDVSPAGTGQNLPAVFSLAQNFPNPFNPETVIRYSIPARARVTLTVYNVIGEAVAVLVDGEQEGGFHDVRFDGSSLASGVYFYRLQSAGLEQTKKLSLLK